MFTYLYQPIATTTKVDPRTDSQLSPLVEDQVSIFIPDALGQVDIRVVQVAVDIMQTSP